MLSFLERRRGCGFFLVLLAQEVHHGKDKTIEPGAFERIHTD
jgi:hypothetical protein